MALGAVGAMRRDARARGRRAAGPRRRRPPPGRRARDARRRPAPRMTYHALRRFLAGGDAVREVTMAKLATQRANFELQDECLRLIGPDPRARARGPRRPPRPDRRRHRRDHARDPRPDLTRIGAQTAISGARPPKGAVTRPLRPGRRWDSSRHAWSLRAQSLPPRRRPPHRVDVLRDVSLEAPAGEVTAVVGPAGAGKTSLLHLLAGLDRPPAARVVLDGRPLRGLDDIELTRLRRDRIGLLLPAASVLPTITVRENITLPLLIARRAARAEAPSTRCSSASASRTRRDERPGQLTAAERQRAALARALVGRPAAAAGRRAGRRPRPRRGRRAARCCCARSPTRTA